MKMKALILILLLASTIFASAQRPKYIGYKHKGVVRGQTLPNGVKTLGGGLLADENYGVLRYTKGSKYMLWLEKITSRDAKGVPSWQVKDVLTFHDLKKNEEFLFSYTSGCTQNGRSNLNLIVKAEFSPRSKTYKVLEAWKANLKREKFEKIAIDGIKCEFFPE